MRCLNIFLVVVLVTIALFASSVRAGPHDDCDFTAATQLCSTLVTQSRCEYFKCLVNNCPTSTMLHVARQWCGMPNRPYADAHKPLVPGGVVAMMRESKGTGREDGSDLMHRATITSPKNQELLMKPDSEEAAMVKRVLEAKREKHGVSGAALPSAASPCHDDISDWSKVKAQQLLHSAAWAGYLDRANEHYTESSPARWSGIDNHVCPQPGNHAPRTSDCSAFVTWIYWSIFGNGDDFLNGENWKAGYTGTLVTRGRNVDLNSLEVGDLCFYYQPMHHVAIYVGDGMVVTHGMDPVGYYKVNYAPLDYCRRYI